MPKAKAKPRPRVQFTEDLLSITSKCIRKFCLWPRDRAVRLPLERGGDVVAHCKALIIDQGGFKVLIGVPFSSAFSMAHIMASHSAPRQADQMCGNNWKEPRAQIQRGLPSSGPRSSDLLGIEGERELPKSAAGMAVAN